MNQTSEAALQDVPSSIQTLSNKGSGVSSVTSVSAGSTNHEDTASQHGVEQSVADTTHDSELPPGYPKLAERMAIAPEIAVFRRFGFLNKLNLLYLQAELMDIEEELKDLQKGDHKKPGYEQHFATDWFYFKEGDHPQARLVRSAREKLDIYSKASMLNFVSRRYKA